MLKIVERHFTDTYDREGPDIVCSMDEKALTELINASEVIPLMMGGEKRHLDAEQVTIDFAFASVVTIKDVKKGEPFTSENIWVKRPGNGEIRAEEFDEILGKIAECDIESDSQLEYKMIKKSRLSILDIKKEQE